jgi:hypothetical protein
MSEIIKHIDGYLRTEVVHFESLRDGDYTHPPHDREFTSWVPAEIHVRCTCGNLVIIQYSEESCEKCGRDFNRSGQELAPRSQWGSEFVNGHGDMDEDLPGMTDDDFQMRIWANE